MKKSRKILSLLLAVVMVFGVLTPAMAEDVVTPPTGVIDKNDLEDPDNWTDESTTVVNIYKLQADSYKDGAPWDHTGGKINDTTTLGTNVKGLAGVTFKIYTMKDEDALAAIMTASPGTVADMETYKTDYPGAVIDEQEIGPTAETTGLVTVNLPDGYYWIIESEKPGTVSSSKAVPFGISLPLTNQVDVAGDDGKTIQAGTKYLKTVHIYPKNITGEDPTIEKYVDELANKSNSYKVGTTFPWIIEVDIPANLSDYTKFEITDEIDAKLTYKGGLKVVYGNFENVQAIKEATTEIVDTDYYTESQPAVDGKGGTLKLTLNETGRENLYTAADPANKLYIYFETIINEDAIMGLEIENDATLTFNNSQGDVDKKDTPEEKPKVVTGGKTFIKVDKNKTDTKLRDAVFQLFDGEDAVTWTADLIAANKEAIEAGKFATKSGDSYTETSAIVDLTPEEPIYLRSAGTEETPDGTFEIKGLEFSSWQKQKWNPTGGDDGTGALENNGDPITHNWNLKEVKAPKDYALRDDAVGFEVNKNSYFNEPTETTQTAADPQEIENKKLTIPQTGGIGTIIFTVGGLALMGGAGYALRKSKKEEEEEA